MLMILLVILILMKFSTKRAIVMFHYDRCVAECSYTTERLPKMLLLLNLK